MASAGNQEIIPTGTFHKKGACVVIIKTEWNQSIVDELENGCRQVLESNNVTHVITFTVPGAVEIPFAIRKCWESMKYRDLKPSAFVALGTVIRGDTPHFDYVCSMVSDGISQLNLTLPVPVVFGVLTLENEQQALERIGGKHGHKGREAGDAALKMILLADEMEAKAKALNSIP